MITKGFTLIEVLVSLAIVSLIGIITFSGLITSLDFNQGTLNRSATTHNIVVLDNLLRRDLQHSVNRLSRDERGDSLAHSFYGGNPVYGGTFLAFTIHTEETKYLLNKGSLRFIEYVLEEKTLKRVEHSYADRTADTKSNSKVLLKNINEISVGFIKDKQLVDEWPEMDWTTNNGLPRMVEISFKIDKLGVVKRRYILPEGIF